MNRKKRTLAIVAALLILLIALPCWPVYRQYQQENKDQALIAAIKTENEGLVIKLLEKGANPNAHDTGERLAFEQVLRRFLSRLHRPQTQSKKTYHPSALALAVDAIDPDSISFVHNTHLALVLLDHGANPNDVVRLNASNEDMTIPVLVHACDSGNSSLVKKLLEKGGDPEAPDTIWRDATPLMVADDVESAQLLIAHGANVNAEDRDGVTVLMHAVEDDNLETVRMLLQHGAKVSMKDPDGYTAITRPVQFPRSHRREILALLKQYEAE